MKIARVEISLAMAAGSLFFSLIPFQMLRADAGGDGVAAATSHSSPSLYRRLGEKKRILKVVGEFVDALGKDDRLQGNPAIGGFWKKLNLRKLKKQLAENVCATTGGPCRGGDVVQKGLEGKAPHPSAIEWLMIIEDLNRVLKSNGVGEAECREIALLVLAAQKQR